jgi:hypothetical protein
MKPLHIVLIAAALAIAVWLGALAWANPTLSGYWDLFLMIIPFLYVLCVIFIGLPVLLFLGIRRRSTVAYVLALVGTGAVIGGAVGTDFLIWSAVLGSLFYGGIALAIVLLCGAEANHTIDADRSPQDTGPPADGRSS